MIQDLKNKKILIVGFGIEGEATYEYLKSHDINCNVSDQKTEDIFFHEYPKMKDEKINFHLGEDYLEDLASYDIIFRTPGVSFLHPKILEVKETGVVISSQIKYFLDNCQAKTIGVTGTKGKGTTATLTYEILKSAGKKVYLGGNVGTPAISFLDETDENSIVVLELSSFQLMDLEKSPNISIVLNVTEDHLDYHADRNEYVASKESIAKFQNPDDILIVNHDYESSKNFSALSQGKVLGVSTSSEIDEGCFVNGEDEIVLKIKNTQEVICRADELLLRGRHNLENVCPAVLASSLAGADIETIKNVVVKFKGLEHRLEFVAEKRGVKYYNDSFSTTLETAEAALKAFQEPIIIIVGGSSKGADYQKLGRMVAEKASRAFIIGDTASDIEKGIKSFNENFPYQKGFSTMESLLEDISRAAKANDVVVLSPGCASFGLFENYKERGKLFKKAVSNLSD